LLVIGLFLSLGACQPTPEERQDMEAAAYSRAAALNTVVAYDEFLRKWPASEYAVDATTSRDRILLAKTRDLTSVKDFIASRPDSPVLSEAVAREKEFQETLDWEQTILDGTKDACTRFLEQYPESGRRLEALNLLDDVLFAEAKTKGTKDAYVEFLAHPEHLKSKEQAKQLLESLRLEDATSGGLAALTRYLVSSPDSPVYALGLERLEAAIAGLGKSQDVAEYLTQYPDSPARANAERHRDTLAEAETKQAVATRQKPVRSLLETLAGSQHFLGGQALFLLAHVAGNLLPDERELVDPALAEYVARRGPDRDVVTYFLTLSPEGIPDEVFRSVLDTLLRETRTREGLPHPPDAGTETRWRQAELLLSRRCDRVGEQVWGLLKEAMQAEAMPADNQYLPVLLFLCSSCPSSDPEDVAWFVARAREALSRFEKNVSLRELRAWLKAVARLHPEEALPLIEAYRSRASAAGKWRADGWLARMAVGHTNRLAAVLKERTDLAAQALLGIGGNEPARHRFVSSARGARDLRYLAHLCVAGTPEACRPLQDELCRTRDVELAAVLSSVLWLSTRKNPPQAEGLPVCAWGKLRQKSDLDADRERAAAWLIQNALTIPPSEAYPLIRLAWALRQTGRQEEAVGLLRLSRALLASHAALQIEAATAVVEMAREVLSLAQESGVERSVKAAQEKLNRALAQLEDTHRSAASWNAIRPDLGMELLASGLSDEDALDAVFGDPGREVMVWTTTLSPVMSAADPVESSALVSVMTEVAQQIGTRCQPTAQWAAQEVLAVLAPAMLVEALHLCSPSVPAPGTESISLYLAGELEHLLSPGVLVMDAQLIAAAGKRSADVVSQLLRSEKPAIRVRACMATLIAGPGVWKTEIDTLLAWEKDPLVMVCMQAALVAGR